MIITCFVLICFLSNQDVILIKSVSQMSYGTVVKLTKENRCTSLLYSRNNSVVKTMERHPLHPYNMSVSAYLLNIYIFICHQPSGLHQLDVVRPARGMGGQYWHQRAALFSQWRSRMAETTQRRKLSVVFLPVA